VAVGLAISFAVTRLLATLLYRVKPLDVVTFSIMSLVLLAVALAASAAPALRAAKTDPMTTLRTQ
jgi:putative ABC transport system permease protein